jgi:hypothetical protein
MRRDWLLVSRTELAGEPEVPVLGSRRVAGSLGMAFGMALGQVLSSAAPEKTHV